MSRFAQQEGILRAHACIRWMTIAWSHQIWWWKIENSRKVTVLLKAISLVLWIPYSPTKNVLHDKNWTFSTRIGSCRFFSSRFPWPFKDFKDSTPKITVPVYVWFSLTKQCISMVWFQTSWFTYQGRKAKNYFPTRDLLISAMSHVKLIENCRVPRRLSPDENWRAKEGGKEKRGETALNLPSLPFRMVPCTLSPVTHVSRSHLFETMRKTTRLRRRLDQEETRVYTCH